jgi:mRNA interferase RelE/StbE
MVWRIEFSKEARRDLDRLDRNTETRIIAFLEGRIMPAANPRQLGTPLQGRFRGYWRYRVGDYRIICDIQDEVITVLVLTIGHRKEVYE